MSNRESYSRDENKLKQVLYKYYFIILILILMVAIFNLVYRLGVEPIKDWDEARHGVNAYEMLKNGNFIVSTFNYENDYWNLKPPLSYWGIILGFKIFGYNLIGFRFMSVLSAFLLIVVVAAFSYKRFGRIASLVSAGVMTTSIHFIQYHGARSGDADSIYVLLFTISIISAINSYYKRTYIYITGFTFALAFLTKSWHTLAIVGVVGLYLIASRLLLKFKLKQWLIFVCCSFGPIILWAIIRIRYDGFRFIHDMVSYDLLSRTSSPIEGHKGFWYAYITLLKLYYKWYMVAFILFLAILVILKKLRYSIKDHLNEVIGLIIWIVIPMVLFSIAKTKLEWYVFPVYPPLAIMIGYITEQCIQSFRKSILPILLCLVIIIPAASYERELIKYIRGESIDIFQNYIMDTKISLDKYNAYIYTPSQYGGPDWSQRNIFALELFKDGRAKEGGIKEFLKEDTNNVLFLENNEESLKLIKENNFKVVDSDKNIITVTKK